MIELNDEILKNRLTGRVIGREVHLLAEVVSTNDYAFKLGVEGAPEGTVVIAETQTKGRGRMNRVWQSPPGKNLYTSIVLRPKIEPAVAPQITLVAGVAVAETLNAFCPGRAFIKWPNDVLIGGRKVCGILTEMKTSAGGIDFVIVGIGININIRESEFDESIRGISTSMREAAGSAVSRLDLTVELYKRLEILYIQFIADGFAAIRRQWLDRTDMVGKKIRVAFEEDIKVGTVAGIDHDGALLLTDEKGATARIIAGDASIMKD